MVIVRGGKKIWDGVVTRRPPMDMCLEQFGYKNVEYCHRVHHLCASVHACM